MGQWDQHVGRRCVRIGRYGRHRPERTQAIPYRQSDEMERAECDIGPTSCNDAPIWREAAGKERVDGGGDCPIRDVMRRRLKVGLGKNWLHTDAADTSRRQFRGTTFEQSRRGN
jgi:hypothetical protein